MNFRLLSRLVEPIRQLLGLAQAFVADFDDEPRHLIGDLVGRIDLLNPVSPAVANVRQGIRNAEIQIVELFLDIGFSVEERFLDGFGREGSGRSHALQLRLALSE